MEHENGSALPNSLIDSVVVAASATVGSISGTEPVYNGTREDSDLSGIVGVVSLIGQGIWQISVGFPKETAVAIAMKFAGFEIAYESDDMGDVVGELANIIAGDVAARLETSGVKTDLSIPAVARGDDIKIMQPNSMCSVYMLFRSSEGEFYIKISTTREPRKREEAGKGSNGQVIRGTW